MKKVHSKNNRPSFLEKQTKASITEHHKAYLGTDIPKDYFTRSKTAILEQVAAIEASQPKKKTIFWLQPKVQYAAAASIAILLSFTIWIQSNNAINTSVSPNTNFEIFAETENSLINSLFVEDTEINAYADAVLVHEVLAKANASEEKLENIFINSLFVNDSLIDNYTDDEFLENIIL